MIKAILIKQCLGTINLAMPLIVLVFLRPGIFKSVIGILVCSVAVGLYVAVLTYLETKKQARSLVYSPSEHCKVLFDQSIAQCGLNPSDVCVRYCYTDNAVALSMSNTVAIDPIMWKNIETDPQVVTVKQVLTGHIAALPADKKAYHDKISNLLCADAQQFIFRHELGHIYYQYFWKKVALSGVIGVITALVGISVACLFADYLIIAVLLGMVAAGVIDLLLSYSSNVFFKYREEQKADLFAVRYSTAQEIRAAADFFERYQACANEYTKPMGFIGKLPQVVLSGHPDGKTRAHFLRKLAAQKDAENVYDAR